MRTVTVGFKTTYNLDVRNTWPDWEPMSWTSKPTKWVPNISICASGISVVEVFENISIWASHVGRHESNYRHKLSHSSNNAHTSWNTLNGSGECSGERRPELFLMARAQICWAWLRKISSVHSSKLEAKPNAFHITTFRSEKYWIVYICNLRLPLRENFVYQLPTQS